MWRILIADDDVEILDYLSNLIPWQENNMEICAKARNGAEALNILKTETVDILLTDITMPGLDGLDLIKEAKKYRKDLKTIILTCHENFTYAKSAIDLGVCGYLVKYMLEPDSLLKVLKTVTQNMDLEKEKQNKLEKAAGEMEKTRNLFVENKLVRLLQGDHILESELEKLAGILDAEGGNVKVAALFFRDRSDAAIQEKDILLYAVKNIVEEIMEQYPVSAPYACGQELLALFLKEDWEDKKVMKAFRETEKCIRELLHVEVTVVISMPHNHLKQFAGLIGRLENCRERHFYWDQNAVIWEAGEEQELGNARPRTSVLTEKIHAADVDGIGQELEKVFEFFRNNQTAPYIVREFYDDFVRRLEEYLYRQGIPDLFEGQNVYSWKGYHRQAQEVLFWFERMLESEEKRGMRDEIRRVMDYVNQNLKERITCEAMAEMVNMNVTYFSKLFKKETGEGFSSYLNRIRTERATMLLQHSDVSIEEITEQVGLSNMHYFYRMYKKMTGRLPGEVRRKR